jgi:hypothetical protein
MREGFRCWKGYKQKEATATRFRLLARLAGLVRWQNFTLECFDECFLTQRNSTGIATFARRRPETYVPRKAGQR